MAVMVFTIPESPSWLLHKRLYERADAALAWLGRDQEEIISAGWVQQQPSTLLLVNTGRWHT